MTEFDRGDAPNAESFDMCEPGLTRGRDGLLGLGADGARRARRAAIIGPVVYAVTIPLAFVSPVACLIAYAALALYFAISFTVAGDAEDDHVTDTR